MSNPNITHLRIQILPSAKNYQVVEFHGDLDKVGQNSIQEQLDFVIENLSCSYLIFDFSDLNFINSEGIGMLMAIHSHLVKIQKQLVLVGAKVNVKDVLDVIGILSLIPAYTTLSAFSEKNSNLGFVNK